MGLSLAVVTPVYGAAEELDEFHERIVTVLEGLQVDFQLIYVDDASPDRSWDRIRTLVDRDHRVLGIRLAHNVRQTRAIFAGVSVAEPGRHILVLDSDLEDPPEAVPQLVDRFLAGHDLVVAHRERPRRSVLRRLGSSGLNLLSKALGLPVTDVGSSFLLSERTLADELLVQLERSGTHLMLPTVVAASRSPVSVTVRSDVQSRTGYAVGAVAAMALEFARTYAFRRLAIPVMAAGAGGVALGVRRGPSRRRWLAAGGVGLLLGTGLWATASRGRVDDGPLFEVAERYRSVPPAPW
jgi:polyisoprenyl-phosphate glycosyltransferase